MTSQLLPGTRAVLHIAPGCFLPYRGQECDVLVLVDAHFARVRFDDGFCLSVPIGYLRPAVPLSVKRRSPLNLTADKDTRTEQQKQAEGVKFLRDRGYVVLVVGQFKHRTKCPSCSHWFFPDGGYGNQKGVMDTLISHPTHWGKPGESKPILGCEWKRSATEPKRTPEQLELAAAGVSVVVWSLPMLAQAVYRFESRWIPAGPLPAVVEWMEKHNLLPDSEEAK